MSRPLIFGAALGGIVLFLWSFVSWTILPWHKADMMTFTNEAEVASVLAHNMTGEGVYTMPGMAPNYQTMGADQKKAADAQMESDMQRGPIMYGMVRGGYRANMGKMMGTAIFFDVLIALLMTMLVLKTGGMSYAGRVSFIMTAALAMALVCYMPNWIWFAYPARWVLTGIADTLIGWLLAGLVIAKVSTLRSRRATA